MKPEQWQQIEELYHAALELEADKRAAYLAEVCAGDDTLRHEVESLLIHDEQAANFIEQPAYEFVAQDLADEQSTMQIGQRISHYQILSRLGAGGMGEVYLAQDSSLKRQVAIKLLPSQFTADAERVYRFEQEARAASSLNHPNILTVHDFGTYKGAPFIVAELLEGEELRAPLRQGALPVRKAIGYAQQITAGLAAAHEKGIVHRDLKPENLFVMKDERIKILDFGLAKLRPPQNGAEGSDVSTQKQLTNPGTVMGTVAYMSPEQVRGEAVDHRSDIFSFGLILFEMLRGERAFQRPTIAETMTAILNDEPPELSESNAKISPLLEKIVRHCLEKKPEMRFQSARDLGFALDSLSTPGSHPGSAGVSPATSAGTAARIAHEETASSATNDSAESLLRSRSQTAGETPALPGTRIWMITAGVMTLIAALALGMMYFRRPALEAEPLRFSINPPEKAKLFDWPTISPDGRTLAFVAEVDGKTQLWVRPLGATTAQPLVELREIYPLPFWSPDSQFIAYFELRKLKKIALTGGAPEILCDTPYHGGGTWNRNGVILFAGGAAGISQVSANGGTVTTVSSVNTASGDRTHNAPTFLPDGRHFLYWINNPDPTKSGIYLAPLVESPISFPSRQ